jgi:hypothetical protein
VRISDDRPRRASPPVASGPLSRRCPSATDIPARAGGARGIHIEGRSCLDGRSVSPARRRSTGCRRRIRYGWPSGPGGSSRSGVPAGVERGRVSPLGYPPRQRFTRAGARNGGAALRDGKVRRASSQAFRAAGLACRRGARSSTMTGPRMGRAPPARPRRGGTRGARTRGAPRRRPSSLRDSHSGFTASSPIGSTTSAATAPPPLQPGNAAGNELAADTELVPVSELLLPVTTLNVAFA